MKKFAVICVIVPVVFFAACQEDSRQKLNSSQRLDTPCGMVNYLQDQELPALESVQIWENQYSQGLKLTTGHYEIFTTLLDPLMISQVPGFMESAYRAYQEQMLEPIDTGSKFTIYIFDKRSRWEKFTRNFAGRQAEVFCKIKAGAYYFDGACVAYNIGRERTFSVLGHEGWHQFNSRHFKYRLPSWLDEGIAMQFESSRYQDGLFYFDPTRNFNRLLGLKSTMANNDVMPLEKLISINPGEVVCADNSAAVTAFYSQAYAMIRFLREEGGGKNFMVFQQMLVDGLYGRWPLTQEAEKIAIDRNIPLTVRWNQSVGLGIFKHYITDDFAQLQEEYLAFCRKIVYRL